ncbi:MAG TPA: ABC transporter ATP-binding protein [Alphaproteobacteria bacterium]|jgi:ABC-2 type transport system ATP-binding protein
MVEAEAHILEVRGLKKAYGRVTAVDDVSFAVRGGEIVGLLGPNGAGKTTIINMILGVLEPSEGWIQIENRDLRKNKARLLARTNFAAVYAQMPGNLTVRQNLHIFGLIYGVKDLRQRIGEVLREFDLERFADTKCGVLSSGEQTRAGLAKALLSLPRLLLLDEPTASLDPSSARIMRSKIKAYGRQPGVGTLWTSHNMHEVSEVCDRVLFLSRGKLLLTGNPKTLPAEHGKGDLEELFIAIAREPLSVKQREHP